MIEAKKYKHKSVYIGDQYSVGIHCDDVRLRMFQSGKHITGLTFENHISV